MKLARILPNRMQLVALVTALALVALLGVANYKIGWQVSFAIFYLLPILIVVHNVGRWPGLIVSVICGITWLVVELESNPLYRLHESHILYLDSYFAYSTGIPLTGLFIILTLLVASVESSLGRAKAI